MDLCGEPKQLELYLGGAKPEMEDNFADHTQGAVPPAHLLHEGLVHTH